MNSSENPQKIFRFIFLYIYSEKFSEFTKLRFSNSRKIFLRKTDNNFKGDYKMQEVETVNFGKCGILNKEYIIPVYKYLYEHQEEYGFTHFRFVDLRNAFGYYSNKEVVYKEGMDDIRDWLLAFGPTLLSKALGMVPRGKYGMIIGHVYKMLAHLVPYGDGLEELRSHIEEVEIEMGMYAGKIEDGKNKGYIYGIYCGEDLLYVGMTCRPITIRIKENVDKIKEGIINIMYKELHEIGLENISFRVIFESESVSRYELAHIEKIFIEYFKPRYNVDGVTAPYKFDVVPQRRELFYDEKLNNIENQLGAIKELVDSLRI